MFDGPGLLVPAHRAARVLRWLDPAVRAYRRDGVMPADLADLVRRKFPARIVEDGHAMAGNRPAHGSRLGREQRSAVRHD